MFILSLDVDECINGCANCDNCVLYLDIDECADRATNCPEANSSDCVNSDGSYTCTCNAEWSGADCKTGEWYWLVFDIVVHVSVMISCTVG